MVEVQVGEGRGLEEAERQELVAGIVRAMKVTSNGTEVQRLALRGWEAGYFKRDEEDAIVVPVGGATVLLSATLFPPPTKMHQIEYGGPANDGVYWLWQRGLKPHLATWNCKGWTELTNGKRVNSQYVVAWAKRHGAT